MIEVIPNKVTRARKRKNNGREQSSDLRYRMTGAHTTRGGLGVVAILRKDKKWKA